MNSGTAFSHDHDAAAATAATAAAAAMPQAQQLGAMAGVRLSPVNQELSAHADVRIQAHLDKDPSFSALLPEAALLERMSASDGGLKTSIEVVAAIMEAYADRAAFHHCPADGKWETDCIQTSFREVWRRVVCLATALLTGGHAQRGGFLAVAGFASVDWVVADIASLYLGTVVVPVPLNVPAADMRHILSEAEVCCLICSEVELPTFAKVLPGCPTVKTLIVMDMQHHEAAASIPAMPETVTTVATINDMESEGATLNPVPPSIPGQEGWEADPLLGLMYTSGSTGSPKGAMYPERLVHRMWSRGFNWSSAKVICPAISLGFMPLNHIAGRLTLYQTITKGGTTIFVRKADMSTFLEDMAYARPTMAFFVPRISNMIFETYQIMLTKALQSAGDGADEATVQEQVRKRVRDEVLGGRMFSILSGTAPTSPEVLDFLRDTCEAPVMDAYGSTEAGGFTLDGRPNRRVVLDIKLVDVPELGYHNTDKPYPRGEFAVKTINGTPGYYRRPEDTKNLLDDEGYYHTGDIMEYRGDELYHWIDRRANVMKLSQGEYVSVSHVEAVYSGHPAIHQIYIYGNSSRSHLLAVIVPAEAWLEGLLRGQQGSSGEDGADATVVKDRLRGVIDTLAREAELQAYEVPRDFIVESMPFSRSNSLLTDSNKPARSRLKAKYGPSLEALYEQLEDNHRKRLRDMRTNPSASVADHVRAAVQLALGLEVASMDTTFRQLGGDSLASVRLVEHLKYMTGVEVGVAVVLDPSVDLAHLVRMVEAADDHGDEEELLFRKVHGEKLGVAIKASDLALEHFIAPADLEEMLSTSPEQEPPGEEAPRVIFLTGATGFLGRNLVLDLVRLVAQPEGDGRVVCLVREASDEAARRRLLEDCLGNPRSSELRRAIAPFESKIEVYAGDLSRPRLGLSKAVYDRLCQEADAVIHAGALVNHTFTYRQLFRPNVMGTAAILRLCLTSRPKPLHYISTVAAAMGGPTRSGNVVSEEQLGSRLFKERPAGGHYAAGYGASKWAGEVILEQAHARTGLPISVYRCSMILPHSQLAGVINTSDIFTRLVSGIIATGLAPRSFFRKGEKPACYDGNSCDLVAGAVASIVDAHLEGLHCYHVVNPHLDDGASADTLVDWIVSAGYTVARVDDYDAWFKQFKGRLEALPDKEKARSPLPVIDQWQHPSPGLGQGTRLDATNFRRAVRRFMGLDNVPRLSEQQLHHALQSMVRLGVIPPVAPSWPPSGSVQPSLQGGWRKEEAELE